MMLILRKRREQAPIDGVDRRGWSEDDYAVVDGEKPVGRIYKESIQGLVASLPGSALLWPIAARLRISVAPGRR
jgi:hypothetical protein